MDGYAACRLCPRECGVDRRVSPGACGMGAEMKIARAMLHLWEEPCISGDTGAGAIFFSGCSLRCAYCQNDEISHLGRGETTTPERLADIMRDLVARGARTIDLVTGTHFAPGILRALALYRPPVPVVWNSGGYESVGAIRALEGAVDVYLPDLKHFSPRLSALCAGAPDYFARASAAIIEMCRQTGAPRYDERGVMLRGTLVRHLVLPGCTADSLKLLAFVREELPPGTPVSLMRQYTPEPYCRVPGLDRRVTKREYDRVLAYARAVGIPGYRQAGDSADARFTPDFRGGV